MKLVSQYDDCATCIKRFAKTGAYCTPNKDGSCAWWEQDPQKLVDRFGKPRETINPRSAYIEKGKRILMKSIQQDAKNGPRIVHGDL